MRQFTTLCILTLVIVCATEGAQSFKRVCYYTSQGQYRKDKGKFLPEDIDPFLCTHFIYAFANVQNNRLMASEWNDETNALLKGMYARFNDVKEKNPSAKTLLAARGWNLGTSVMLSSKANRRKFLRTSIALLRKNNFDGLDLDFEHLESDESIKGDKQNFTQLCKELSARFKTEVKKSGKPRLLLTAAVAAEKSKIDKAYEIRSLCRLLDFVNLKAYDFHNEKESMTGHHAPFKDGKTNFSMLWAANYWETNGCWKKKIIIGMPMYGNTYYLSSPDNYKIGAAVKYDAAPSGIYTRKEGVMSYYEVCDFLLNRGASMVLHSPMKVPYAHKANVWVGFDDAESLTKKAKWAKKKGFGGWMAWSIDMDDFNCQSCRAGKYPLLRALNRATGGGLVTNGQNTNTDWYATTTATTTAPSECDGGYEDPNFCEGKADTNYRHQYRCDMYIQCTHGFTFYRSCPSSLHFDEILFLCNWPAAAKCPY